MKKRILLLAITMITINAMHAQSWQWGKRGGSSDTHVGFDETVMDMATDQKGNVYVLSRVMKTGLNVDGHPVAGYGGDDILLTSFRCDGTYRWSKDIGSSSNDDALGLKTDSLGGVYVAATCIIYYTDQYVGTDTFIAGSGVGKEILLVKYDTAGNYKWVRMPQPDTCGIYSLQHSSAIDIDVDGNGNIFMLCYLPPGAYAGGAYVVTAQGYYILKFDRYGTCLGGNQMQISTTSLMALLKMKKDFGNGRYYITGGVPLTGVLSFATNTIANTIFLGCFNNSGALLWSRQNTHNTGNPTSRAALDAQHNVYISSISSGVDTFNGYYIANGGVPVVVKLDTNGNNMWARNAITNAATFCKTIQLNGNEVVIAGQYPGKLQWSGYSDSLNHSSGVGYDVFFTRFNAATGAVVAMDSIASNTGMNEHATAMTADRFGNFYIGGDFASSLYVHVAGDTLASAGGGSDFFVAKYGYSNCSSPISLEAMVVSDVPQARIYPNPTTEELFVEHAGEEATIILFNIMGQRVYSTVAHSDKEAINTRSLAPGTYILQITGKDGSRVMRNVVKD